MARLPSLRSNAWHTFAAGTTCPDWTKRGTPMVSYRLGGRSAHDGVEILPACQFRGPRATGWFARVNGMTIESGRRFRSPASAKLGAERHINSRGITLSGTRRKKRRR